MEWKDIASWLWIALGALGGIFLRRQESRMDRLERDKADKKDVDKSLDDRRQDIKELYALNANLRTDMMEGFGQIKDLIHEGNKEIMRELSRKADK